jgi:hypothetical protein
MRLLIITETTLNPVMEPRSRKRFWIVLGAALLLIAAASALYVEFGRGPPEPVYEGVRLSAWLDGSTTHGAPAAELIHRANVLYAVGPEALPWLVHAFEIDNGREGRSKLHRWYVRFYFNNPRMRPFIPVPSNPRWGGIAQYNTLNIVARLAPGTPFEERVLRGLLLPYDGDRLSENARLHALGFFTNLPAVVVPVLLSSLTNPATIDISIESLRPFSTFASGGLYKMAAKETGSIRPAELALEKVDPKAYAKLWKEKNPF